jgi:hypothetical protein
MKYLVLSVFGWLEVPKEVFVNYQNWKQIINTSVSKKRRDENLKSKFHILK